MKQKELKLTGKNVISIDIGQHTTKMVAGKPGKDKLTVEHAVTIPTPKDSCEKGQITNFETLKQSIGSKLNELKIRSRMALCSVENGDIITREISVPTASEEEIANMLQFEITQYMPIELNDYLVQSKILDEFVEEGVSKTRVLVTAVPRELGRSYYDLLHSLGFHPAVMDIQSNAVDKLIHADFFFNNEKDMKDKVVAVIDMGYNHMNVILFEQGQYKFNRFMNLGARNIDYNLANFMDISYEEAEKYKSEIDNINDDLDLPEEGIDPEDERARKMRVLNIIRNTVDGWTDDIERVFRYYLTRGTRNAIDVIYIYGGTASMKGLDQYLYDAFNIPVKKVDNISNVQVSNFNGSDSMSEYVNALGTMIRR
ncbi:MAG: type IV pilus assembly protein PilM [Tindallia sp. MSAO_Bac2]|nr:MAG: type IV pilus assembly protein PilM [Tindallia sp. MSAO_Bac2]